MKQKNENFIAQSIYSEKTVQQIKEQEEVGFIQFPFAASASALLMDHIHTHLNT